MGYCRINLILDLINCITHYFATYEDTIREIKWELKHIFQYVFQKILAICDLVLLLLSTFLQKYILHIK